MDGKDIDLIERKPVFQGYFRVDLYTLRHRLFDGGWSRIVTREVFERGHSVAVLLFDPVADAVVLVEQFRAGAVAADLPAWQIECAAGIMGEGETPEAVARRESIEETACEIRRIEPIGQVIYSPGACSEICRIFIGEIDSVGAGGVHGLKEENEDIKLHVLPAQTAIAWLDSGRMTTGALLIAMLWFARHHESLRSRWLQPQADLPELAS
jgi:ADP-ribose pyrophosphatase